MGALQPVHSATCCLRRARGRTKVLCSYGFAAGRHNQVIAICRLVFHPKAAKTGPYWRLADTLYHGQAQVEQSMPALPFQNGTMLGVARATSSGVRICS